MEGVSKHIILFNDLDVRTEAKDTKFSSKAYGNRENKAINLDGRIQLDMLQVMQRDYKLRSYTLNAVCAQFLGKSQSSYRKFSSFRGSFQDLRSVNSHCFTFLNFHNRRAKGRCAPLYHY